MWLWARLGAAASSPCGDVLDALDARFDAMRAARQNETARMNLGRRLPEREWWDAFEPEANCSTDERFGSKARSGRHGAMGDGSKFVCGIDYIAQRATKEGCVVYSVGSNNDVSFERAVHHRMPGCDVFTFDPTVKEFAGHDYSTFHPWGIGRDGENMTLGSSNWTAKGLETVMRELGHTGRKIDILKMDCEGCEYYSLPSFFDAIAAGRARIGQLQVEMHLQSHFKPHFVPLQTIHEFFGAADRAGLRIFHKERNHWGGCMGYACVEYAFASEAFLREANAATICPKG